MIINKNISLPQREKIRRCVYNSEGMLYPSLIWASRFTIAGRYSFFKQLGEKMRAHVQMRTKVHRENNIKNAKVCFYIDIVYLPDVNGPVFVVAPVEEDGARKDDQQRTKQQQHLHGALAAVHKVSVEHVRVFSARQPVLQHTHKQAMNLLLFPRANERQFDASDFFSLRCSGGGRIVLAHHPIEIL